MGQKDATPMGTRSVDGAYVSELTNVGFLSYPAFLTHPHLNLFNKVEGSGRNEASTKKLPTSLPPKRFDLLVVSSVHHRNI